MCKKQATGQSARVCERFMNTSTMLLSQLCSLHNTQLSVVMSCVLSNDIPTGLSELQQLTLSPSVSPVCTCPLSLAASSAGRLSQRRLPCCWPLWWTPASPLCRPCGTTSWQLRATGERWYKQHANWENMFFPEQHTQFRRYNKCI